MREALFSILGPLTGKAVLDLYAGTGALGIEALSRGAASAVFVESARTALPVLRRNLADLGLEGQARVFAMPVEAFLRKAGSLGPFDLVFADPPYAELDLAMQSLARLGPAGALGDAASFVVEHDPKQVPSAPGLEIDETRAYGDAALSFLHPV